MLKQNSIPWLDALSLRAREHDSALFFFFFWLSKRVSFICLFLWEKRSSFFRSAGLASPHCCTRLRQGIKCTHRTHSVPWGSEIWSQVATGDVYKCKVGRNTSLWGVHSLRTTVETRSEQARHSEKRVTRQFRNRLFTFYCFIKTRWQFTASNRQSVIKQSVVLIILPVSET